MQSYEYSLLEKEMEILSDNQILTTINLIRVSVLIWIICHDFGKVLSRVNISVGVAEWPKTLG